MLLYGRRSEFNVCIPIRVFTGLEFWLLVREPYKTNIGEETTLAQTIVVSTSYP
jgi:hypothetical protein